MIVHVNPACHSRAWRLLHRKRYLAALHREIDSRRETEERKRSAMAIASGERRAA